jgi:hypothetical protein
MSSSPIATISSLADEVAALRKEVATLTNQLAAIKATADQANEYAHYHRHKIPGGGETLFVKAYNASSWEPFNT